MGGNLFRTSKSHITLFALPENALVRHITVALQEFQLACISNHYQEPVVYSETVEESRLAEKDFTHLMGRLSQ